MVCISVQRSGSFFGGRGEGLGSQTAAVAVAQNASVITKPFVGAIVSPVVM